MVNNSATQTDIHSINSDTKSVTHLLVNTHCIVCGSAFSQARKGKLYCSARCKQFGYNHKDEIDEVLSERDKGINKRPMVFSIDDYIEFDKNQKMLKRFRELQNKKIQCEAAEQELVHRKHLGLPMSNYLFDTYVRKKLTEDEEGELYDIETVLDERLIDLAPKELSLEQWSFIKSLHPSVDNLSFFEIVCSLSKQFLSQLSLSSDEINSNSEHLLIKNKFRNHCNLIASGVIKFQKRQENE